MRKRVRLWIIEYGVLFVNILISYIRHKTMAISVNLWNNAVGSLGGSLKAGPTSGFGV